MSSQQPLFTVEEVFLIKNRGFMLLPEHWLSDAQVRASDWVELRFQRTEEPATVRVLALDTGRWSEPGEKYLDQHHLGCVLVPLASGAKVQPGDEVWTARPEAISAEMQKAALAKQKAQKSGFWHRLFQHKHRA